MSASKSDTTSDISTMIVGDSRNIKSLKKDQGNTMKKQFTKKQRSRLTLMWFDPKSSLIQELRFSLVCLSVHNAMSRRSFCVVKVLSSQ